MSIPLHTAHSSRTKADHSGRELCPHWLTASSSLSSDLFPSTSCSLIFLATKPHKQVDSRTMLRTPNSHSYQRVVPPKAMRRHINQTHQPRSLISVLWALLARNGWSFLFKNFKKAGGMHSALYRGGRGTQPCYRRPEEDAGRAEDLDGATRHLLRRHRNTTASQVT
ncbi:uncharacterized protein EDB91DRAFT_1159902 [Suillus paluster]|uniref:uncharacterized protein n=1 Tax=Suillus paluster TaxID=48578 RepID=UPI001B884F90|nr:uncharacterized protein EDB91DRAFT_1159902 [Suillus paluster]KAG1729187.1 hypothetical protein EDB91DRAFT_1159902 [Suillus paluster]